MCSGSNLLYIYLKLPIQHDCSFKDQNKVVCLLELLSMIAHGYMLQHSVNCSFIIQQPKLFDGMRFYLHGDYTKSYRGFLQDLVIAAGGTVLHRKPVSRDQQKLLDDSSPVIVVYSLENQEKVKFDADQCRRQADDAQVLACASGGKAATSAWIIDSVAACNLQPL
jgi:hypothetical protein